MTDGLAPFSGHEVRCGKCHGTVAAEYRPAGTKMICVTDAGVIWRFSAGAPEWLLRQCTDCRYCWAESCADAHVSTMFKPQEGP